jgi:hypothetical protein
VAVLVGAGSSIAASQLPSSPAQGKRERLFFARGTPQWQCWRQQDDQHDEQTIVVYGPHYMASDGREPFRSEHIGVVSGGLGALAERLLEPGEKARQPLDESAAMVWDFLRIFATPRRRVRDGSLPARGCATGTFGRAFRQHFKPAHAGHVDVGQDQDP